jgi:uncharacterized protein YjlB
MMYAAKRESIAEVEFEAEGQEPPLPPGVEVLLLADDGLVPNNPRLPLVLYRGALETDGLKRAPERAFEALFQSNGWLGAWVDGIYDFHHYHSTAHEVLGIAKGAARVMFGGAQGPAVELAAGDAVAIAAGVGHCLVEGDEQLVVVGAYPVGQNWDLCRATPTDRDKALENIPWVPLPEFDPIFGPAGPILDLWME